MFKYRKCVENLCSYVPKRTTLLGGTRHSERVFTDACRLVLNGLKLRMVHFTFQTTSVYWFDPRSNHKTSSQQYTDRKMGKVFLLLLETIVLGH